MHEIRFAGCLQSIQLHNLLPRRETETDTISRWCRSMTSRVTRLVRLSHIRRLPSKYPAIKSWKHGRAHHGVLGVFLQWRLALPGQPQQGMTFNFESWAGPRSMLELQAGAQAQAAQANLQKEQHQPNQVAMAEALSS